MGKLVPGASYIYERNGGITYAREFGTTNRKIVGMDYPTFNEIEDQMQQEMLLRDILREAKANPALQIALDRVIMVYKLSKEKLDGQ